MTSTNIDSTYVNALRQVEAEISKVLIGQKDMLRGLLIGLLCDALQRGAQIALDIVDERLERRDVKHAHAGRRGRRKPAEPIDRREEGGKRLAAACRCDKKCVFARRESRPTEPLHRCRRFESRFEPGARRLSEL